MIMESDSKGKDSGLESSIKPGEWHIYNKNTLINKNRAKTRLAIKLCQGRFIST